VVAGHEEEPHVKPVDEALELPPLPQGLEIRRVVTDGSPDQGIAAVVAVLRGAMA
jgi:hypothetical protein